MDKEIKNKFLIVLASLCLVTSLSACGGSDIEEDASNTDKVVEQTDKKKSEKKKTDKKEKETPKEESKESTAFTPVQVSDIPAFSGNPFVVINNNQPSFSSAELTTTGYESYSSLDSLAAAESRWHRVVEKSC